MCKSVFQTLFVLTALLPLVAVPASAGDEGERNLLFTITVVDTGPDGEAAGHSARMLVFNRKQAHLAAGWKMPIPTQTAVAEGDCASVTSYSYQDVGFLAWVEGFLREDGVHASGRIEISSVEPGAGAETGGAPTIASFSQKFEVVLQEGVEATLAEAPRPGGGSRRLTLAVEVGP